MYAFIIIIIIVIIHLKTYYNTIIDRLLYNFNSDLHTCKTIIFIFMSDHDIMIIENYFRHSYQKLITNEKLTYISCIESL